MRVSGQAVVRMSASESFGRSPARRRIEEGFRAPTSRDDKMRNPHPAHLVLLPRLLSPISVAFYPTHHRPSIVVSLARSEQYSFLFPVLLPSSHSVLPHGRPPVRWAGVCSLALAHPGQPVQDPDTVQALPCATPRPPIWGLSHWKDSSVFTARFLTTSSRRPQHESILYTLLLPDMDHYTRPITS